MPWLYAHSPPPDLITRHYVRACSYVRSRSVWTPRIKISAFLAAVSYTYDAADRRATMTVAGQTAVAYTFDNADRLGITQGGASVALAYDHANRRTSLTLPNGIVGTTTYDAAGRRSPTRSG